MVDAVAAQRNYYERTAAHYDSMHMGDADTEHAVALAAFIGIAGLHDPASVLDVGAGTGRGLMALQRAWPQANVVGIEPVAALRTEGHKRGISEASLIGGDATAIDFPDNSFDFVIETGVLHHVPDPHKAVREMARVARKGVMISDSNVYGQGSAAARRLKSVVRSLGLWKTMIRVQTRGKMHKWSEGDGIYFSYSVFDSVPALRDKFPKLLMMSTAGTDAADLRRGTPQAMILALK